MKQRSEIETAAIEWAKARFRCEHATDRFINSDLKFDDLKAGFEKEQETSLRLLVLCTAEIALESEVVEPAPEQLGIEAKA